MQGDKRKAFELSSVALNVTFSFPNVPNFLIRLEPPLLQAEIKQE